MPNRAANYAEARDDRSECSPLAVHVAAAVLAALLIEGIHPCEFHDADLTRALAVGDVPLTVDQIATVAERLGTEPELLLLRAVSR